MDLDARAKDAFEAFHNARPGARRPPPWELLPELDKNAWRAVAKALDTSEVYWRESSPSQCVHGVRDCNCGLLQRAVRFQ